MNKRFVKLLAISLGVVASLAMLLAVARALNPRNTNLVGTWNNVDSNTADIVQIIIADDGVGGITVHAFGACSPDPCDWGIVPGVAYSTSTSDANGKFFTATYDFGFEITVLAGGLQDDGRLVVHEFTEFTDGSNRYNYHSVDTFQQ